MNVSLRMNERETVRFVELYESEPVLWNVTDPRYNKKDARTAALERIVAQLEIENFTSKHVLEKFKNLRSSYLQELKKIKNSTKSGCSADDVYVPKVVWFPIMHRFLMPHVKSRKTHSNLNDTQSQDHQDQEIHVMDTETQDTAYIHTQDINTQDEQATETQDILNQEQVSLRKEEQSDNWPNNPSASTFKRNTGATAVSHQSSQCTSSGKKRKVVHTLANS
ncbi:uncharacterized protein LOC126883884 [Diabrotica virgifera virgifera]|uniref:MADF domain-containing protein n=1 Tax=Diabrotica virgifera virgifera TaxID=50390 RepID=A0ABM5K5S4_DIAVI|nr:uncharacterized protein LOC126883884 [Diabrotica virgifera virgifera]